jgi:hypothetical protein
MGKITAGAGSTKKAELLRSNYRIARLGLLIATVFSALNCIFAFFAGVFYFYSEFSYCFPLAMINNARFQTGMMYTPEEYEQMFGLTQSDFLHPDFLLLDGSFALIAIAALVVCWVLSKKHVGALIAAAVLLGVDILFGIYWYDFSITYFTEYLFPGMLMASLIIGIVSHYRLKFIEWTGEDVTVPAVAETAQPAQETGNSPVLHPMDYGAKSKILLACDVGAYAICYRRFGSINELAINDMVYDTVDTGKNEQPHELHARLDGHEIAVGLGEDGNIYVRFDGEVVKKKPR